MQPSARRRPPASSFCFALAMSVLITSACGYRPLHGPGLDALDGAEASELRRGSKRLAVMAFRNDSPEPWLDRILTDALRREMDARGALRLVNDPASAELVLRGRIQPLIVLSRSFSSFVAAIEYSVTLQLDLEVVRSNGDVIRLDPAMLSETDVYLASADIEVTRKHRLELLRRLSDLLASRIADSIELIERPIEIRGEGA